MNILDFSENSVKQNFGKLSTQKARGLAALLWRQPAWHRLNMDGPLDHYRSLGRVSEFFVVQGPMPEGEIALAEDRSRLNIYLNRIRVGDDNSEVFARPCPPDPRHGYRESKVVHTADDILDMLRIVLSDSPLGEIILTPKIFAVTSAVWAAGSGVLGIGLANDSVTSGKFAFSLPVVQASKKVFDAAMCTNDSTSRCFCDYCKMFFTVEQYKELSGTSEPDLFFELVSGQTYDTSNLGHPPTPMAYLVQARGGPVLPSGVSEYIPRKVQIARIITPTDEHLSGTLSAELAWEKLCKENSGEKGLVAWAPNASLASHPAVHCVSNKIPFLTREEPPMIGQIIRPLRGSIQPEFSREEYARGMAISQEFMQDVSSVGYNLSTASAILHNAAALSGSIHWARLLGYATATLFRAASIAILGEARHGKDSMMQARWAEIYESVSKPERTTVYSKHLSWALGPLCEWTSEATERMMNASLFSGAMGGFKWFHIGVETIALYNRMTEADPDKILGQANRLLTLSHNCGWAFDKFGSKECLFDVQATHPGGSMFVRSHMLYRVLTSHIGPMIFSPRTKRVSGDWTLDSVQKVITVEGDLACRITVNETVWQLFPWNDECREVVSRAAVEL
jgi:hypothetical protein